jgi:hypothetical protein
MNVFHLTVSFRLRQPTGENLEIYKYTGTEIQVLASHDTAGILFDFSGRGPDVMRFFEIEKVTVNQKSDMQSAGGNAFTVLGESEISLWPSTWNWL